MGSLGNGTARFDFVYLLSVFLSLSMVVLKDSLRVHKVYDKETHSLPCCL